MDRWGAGPQLNQLVHPDIMADGAGDRDWWSGHGDVMLGVFRPEPTARRGIGWLAVMALALAAWLIISNRPRKATLFNGALSRTVSGCFMKVMTLLSSEAARFRRSDLMREVKRLKSSMRCGDEATAGIVDDDLRNDRISAHLGLGLQKPGAVRDGGLAPG